MVSALVFSHTHATENFAPDITNGDAYRNNAIIGLDSKTSYIRLANFRDSQEPVRNYVEVYSLTAQKTLGRFEIDVRSKSSIQLSYRSIMGLAGISLDDAAAQDLVLYIQNGREKQLWQHVQYDLTTRTLNNATVCSTAPHTDYIAPHNVLMNVHSSSMPTHTSLITIHNFTDIDTTMQANIYNAASGEAIGFVPLRLPARSSFNETAAWFEDQMNFKPTAAQYHYSIELVPTSVPQAKVVVGHVIANLTTGAGTNLSNPCALHGGIISLDDPT
jgi:hypothetical protein